MTNTMTQETLKQCIERINGVIDLYQGCDLLYGKICREGTKFIVLAYFKGETHEDAKRFIYSDIIGNNDNDNDYQKYQVFARKDLSDTFDIDPETGEII